MTKSRSYHRTANFLRDVHCNPEVAAHVIEGARDLYAACARLRRARLPGEALQIVSQIEATTIAFGQWLRDHGIKLEDRG